MSRLAAPNVRGYRTRLVLPTTDRLTGHPPLRKAVENVTGALAVEASVRATLANEDAARRQARTADRQARADAAQANRADPGPVLEARLDGEIGAAQTLLPVREELVTRAIDALVAAYREHGPKRDLELARRNVEIAGLISGHADAIAELLVERKLNRQELAWNASIRDDQPPQVSLDGGKAGGEVASLLHPVRVAAAATAGEQQQVHPRSKPAEKAEAESTEVATTAA